MVEQQKKCSACRSGFGSLSDDFKVQVTLIIYDIYLLLITNANRAVIINVCTAVIEEDTPYAY